MTGVLHVRSAGPSLTLQDLGRSGFLAQGLAPGGAADRTALYEGAALLGQSPDLAAIEMVGVGGTFESSIDTVIALTGAPMAASIEGTPVVWNASHVLPAGAPLVIGGASMGAYGYLTVAGGINADVVMGARSAHLKAGVGKALAAGDALPIATPKAVRSGMKIAQDNRFSGGTINVLSSLQTHLFSQETQDRFVETEFKRDARGNRQGVRMDSAGEGFFVDGGLSIVSEVILTGDIQITGEGDPYVLMCECQTTGGYPRIGTVLPSDLPRVAQAPVGTPLRFRFIDRAEAIALETRARAELQNLGKKVEPLVRNLADISDLLSYQLVGGAVSALADPYDD
ncbi:MAG: biotin-dependent carboxyltransferase family protein [Roseobacter sp.]